MNPRLFKILNFVITKITYQLRYKNEILYYTDHFDEESLNEKVPNVWMYVEKFFSEQIEKKTGFSNLYQYVANHCKDKETVNILGLGSGPCGNEIDGIVPLLKEKKVSLTAIDINKNLLNQAKIKADQIGLKFVPIVQDINKLQLSENAYDIIVAYASLHHFLELDHITKEINKSLKQDGIFATVDIPTRNGYLMWGETYEIVKSLWKVLPNKYKVAHNKNKKPTLEKKIINRNYYSIKSFECINSEDILPSLRSNLIEIVYVPAFAFIRRFFDSKFGPNYNMKDPLDRSMFEFIKNLDQYYIENEILKPETFFGAYVKKP